MFRKLQCGGSHPATNLPDQVPLERVLVVYDDLDLENGAVRLRAKGGHGGHNGMRSVTQHFSGSKDFPRLRIGALCCCLLACVPLVGLFL